MNTTTHVSNQQSSTNINMYVCMFLASKMCYKIVLLNSVARCCSSVTLFTFHFNIVVATAFLYFSATCRKECFFQDSSF